MRQFLGCVPSVLWCDAATVSRHKDMHLAWIPHKGWRWLAEATGDGSEYRSCAVVGMQFAYYLPRNATNRAEMERSREIENLRRMVREFNLDEFLGEVRGRPRESQGRSGTAPEIPRGGGAGRPREAQGSSRGDPGKAQGDPKRPRETQGIH